MIIYNNQKDANSTIMRMRDTARTRDIARTEDILQSNERGQGYCKDLGIYNNQWIRTRDIARKRIKNHKFYNNSSSRK